MDDILFQLDLVWTIFNDYLRIIDNDNCNQDILVRLYSIQFYWKNVLNESFQLLDIHECTFFKDDMKTTKEDIVNIHERWIECMHNLSNEELHSTKYCKWPFDDRSFFSLALWVNIEFMKYVSEIGIIYEKNSG